MKKQQNILETARKKRYIHLLRKLKDGALSNKEIGELEQLEKGTVSKPYNWRALNQQTVLSILNTRAHTINKWVDKGCPIEYKDGKKTYDVAKILNWRIEYQKQLDQYVPEDPDVEGIHGDAKGELLRVKIEREKFDLGVKKGDYITKEIYEQEFREAGDYIRQSFQNIPKKLSLKLSKVKELNEIEKVISEEINSILKHISTI